MSTYTASNSFHGSTASNKIHWCTI